MVDIIIVYCAKVFYINRQHFSSYFYYDFELVLYLYILRGFRKLVIAFFPIKNTPKLINQQLKNGVKIVN